MPEGARVTGPALIEEMDSTTLLHPGNVAKVRADGSLVMDLSASSGANAATKGRLAPERDPTTLTVVSNSLRNICDEMGSAMVRTAYSPIFSESRDFSCLLFDRKVRMIGQVEMNPAIICAGLHTVPHCVAEFGADNFHPGDVVVHNDPYRGQCHMPEHLLLKPVFIGNTLIGYAGNIAHIGEIGGMAVGSFASTATEVFQEGLRLPPVKLMDRGEYVKDIWRVVLANHRTPDPTWGDFHAMMGSLTTAERRLQALVGRYGLDDFERICDSLIEHGEAWMRKEIGKIPNGIYTSEDYFEDDGVTTNSYYFRSRVHVGDDEIVIDLSDSDKQARGPINATYVATSAASCTAILQSICARDVPLNAGTFRPIRVIAPPGTLVNPIFPAPSVAGNTVGQASLLGARHRAADHRLRSRRNGQGHAGQDRSERGRHRLQSADGRHASRNGRVLDALPARGLRLGRPSGQGRQQLAMLCPRQHNPGDADRGVREPVPAARRRSAPSWKPTGRSAQRSSSTSSSNAATSCCCIRRAAAATAAQNSAATAPCRTISAIVSLRRRVWRRMGGHQASPMRCRRSAERIKGLRPVSGLGARWL
jgi:hypothetical protein